MSEELKDFTIPHGLIHNVYDVMQARFPAINKQYLFSCAEVLVSSVCWKIYTLDKYGKLQPSIWIQTILPSGSGKSVPLDNFILPVLRTIGKRISTKEKIYNLDLSDYTPEAVNKFFNDKKKIYNLGLLNKDEKTMFLRAALDKKYMVGILELESKIYDGKGYRRLTIVRGDEGFDYAYKANLSASTPLMYKFLANDDFIQGCWNRYDFIIQLIEEIIEKLSDDFFIPKNGMSDFESEINDVIGNLTKLITDVDVRICLDDEAKTLWINYHYKKKTEANKLDDSNLLKGYLSRDAEKALKRAVLYTVSARYNIIDGITPTHYIDFNDEEKNEKIIACTAEEMKTAIDNQEVYLKHFKEMLESRKKYKPVKSETQTDRTDREHIRISLDGLSLVSRTMIKALTEWNDGIKLQKNIDWAEECKFLVRLSDEEVEKLFNEHKDDIEWFTTMMVSKIYHGNPPALYTVHEVED